MLKDLPPEAQAKLKPEIAAVQATCAHHWQIEKARGPTSKARCVNCDATKEFANDLTPQQYRDVATHRSAFNRAEREAEMPQQPGGFMTRRAREIAPAREKATKLFEAGKTMREVRVELGPEWGEISDATLYNWQSHAKKNGHAAAAAEIPPATTAEKAGRVIDKLQLPNASHPALKVLLDMLPVDDGKHALWLKAFQATYELLYLEVAQ